MRAGDPGSTSLLAFPLGPLPPPRGEGESVPVPGIQTGTPPHRTRRGDRGPPLFPGALGVRPDPRLPPPPASRPLLTRWGKGGPRPDPEGGRDLRRPPGPCPPRSFPTTTPHPGEAHGRAYATLPRTHRGLETRPPRSGGTLPSGLPSPLRCLPGPRPPARSHRAAPGVSRRAQLPPRGVPRAKEALDRLRCGRRSRGGGSRALLQRDRLHRPLSSPPLEGGEAPGLQGRSPPQGPGRKEVEEAAHPPTSSR